MAGLVERILKLKNLTTPMSSDDLEKDVFAPWRNSFDDLEEYQPEVNAKYEDFLLKNAHEDYFRIKQLHEIGYDADIYIALTKRNCGKTYSYMQLCAEIIERGEEFVIVRNSQLELKNAVQQQFRDYSYFFRNEIVCKGNCVYERIPYEEVKGKKTIEKYEDKLVGYLAYLSGTTQAFQGSSYPKAKTIIWDEATNAGKTTKETGQWINAFWQLVITFFRGKKGCKMYIFGNLMNYTDKDDNMRIADTLIKDLGITPDDNMKYIIRGTVDRNGKKQEVKLLYINTRDLYNTYGLTTTNILMDKGRIKALAENRPTTSGRNVVGEIDFIRAHGKMFGVHGRYANKNYIIQIAWDPDIPLEENHIKAWKEGQTQVATGKFYIIRVTSLNRYTLGFKMPIYTDDPVAYSTHKDVLTLTTMMPKAWWTLSRLLKGAPCVFVGDASYSDLYLLMHSHKHYIEEYERESEPTSKGKRRKRGV